MGSDFADFSEVDQIRGLFLQAFIANKILTSANSLKLYNACCKKLNFEAPCSFDDFIVSTNRELDAVGLKLSQSSDFEENSETHFALINNTSDELSQTATSYSAIEIAFLKRIIEAFVNTEDESFRITSSEALRESSKIKTGTISKKEAEKFMDRLEADGWLYQKPLGSLNLTLRAQMELSTYLREEFEESLHKCHLCKEFITTRSQKCADPDCTARLHNSCAARLFRNKDPAARQCPECPNPWDNNQLVEDDDIEEDSDMDG